jgi:hypothetical protein
VEAVCGPGIWQRGHEPEHRKGQATHDPPPQRDSVGVELFPVVEVADHCVPLLLLPPPLLLRQQQLLPLLLLESQRIIRIEKITYI